MNKSRYIVQMLNSGQQFKSWVETYICSINDIKTKSFLTFRCVIEKPMFEIRQALCLDIQNGNCKCLHINYVLVA